MAPTRAHKRPRAETETADSISRNPSDATQSPIGRDRSKRLRQSTAPEDTDLDSSSDEEVLFARNDSATELQEDLEEDDVRHQEMDDLRATQVVEREMKHNRNRKNTPADNGIIEEIRCTNFMCHEQLTVPLGPLINFIIGHNGSGKSAVLTALTLCLGGKATATNRGQNLKSFIKEGKDSCTLSVKIKNQGTSAYRPDTYGRSIIVERFITKSTSGFKLKDANGKMVSTKKQELENILDAFALQMDNPMNVLTQDMARQFLSDSSGKDKYRFFMKGTQLETLNADYKIMGDSIDEIEKKLNDRQEVLSILKKQYDTAKKKANRASNVKLMRSREKECKDQMAWAAVETEEKNLKAIETDVAQVNAVIRERQNTADDASARYERSDELLEQAKQHVSACTSQVAPLEDQQKELDDQFKQNKQDLMDKQSTKRTIAATLLSKDKNIQAYQAKIEECQQRQANADGGRHQQLLAEIEQAKQDAEDAKAELDQHQRAFPELRRRRQQLEDELAQKKVHRSRKQQEVQRAQSTVNSIQQGQRNWADAYHPSLQQLLREIDREKRFRERPIGPMGKYIEITKPEWTSILEKQSGSALNGFIVTSQHDQRLLSELARRAHYNCPIYISDKRKINTAQHEPDRELDTWLRILKFTDDQVRNQLIINAAIEQIVLIRDRDEAVEFITGPPDRRRNVVRVFSMSEESEKKGHQISLANSGGLNIGPIDEWNQRNYRMKAEAESLLNSERANLRRLQEELREIGSAITDCDRRLAACNAELSEHTSKTNGIKDREQRAQELVEQLTEELSNATPIAGEIDRLRELIQTEEEEKEFQVQQLNDLKSAAEVIHVEQHKIRDQQNELANQLQSAKVELYKAEAKVTKLTGRREDALREKNNALDAVAQAQNELSELERALEVQSATVENMTQQASVLCPTRVEVPAGQDYDSLQRVLQRLIQNREQTERELGGSEEDLLLKANEAKLTYTTARNNTEQLVKDIEALKSTLLDRNRRWHKFRRHIASRARITFGYLLSERNFRGQLTIDHTAKSLEIHVEPDITRANDEGRQAKTLSGGEKSFSTICLLLALWDAMGSPIRCLDEFDVFMDNVNRDISMRMMIGAARRAVGRQYILITPQAMGNVTLEEDVKIIKMRDPERGQTAISFGTQ